MGLLSLLGSRKPSQAHLLVEVTLRQGAEGKGQKAQRMVDWRRAVIRLLLVVPFLGVVALLMSSSAAANSNAQSQKQLFDCVNDGLSQQLTTYKDFALQRPAR
jgi:lipopolysaccharide/colanic/teichoic acid biosynthesis glycosyltransferase